jgi:hypothetical protein
MLTMHAIGQFPSADEREQTHYQAHYYANTLVYELTIEEMEAMSEPGVMPTLQRDSGSTNYPGSWQVSRDRGSAAG